jgi:hypothetical protein
MPGALKKITTRAKTIYKKGGTWKGAIKKAGVEYRAGKLGRVGKSGRKKVARKRKRVGATPARSAAVKKVRRLHKAEGRAMKALGSVNAHVNAAKSLLKNDIAQLETRRVIATTKKSIRHLNKMIAEKNRQYRALS